MNTCRFYFYLLLPLLGACGSSATDEENAVRNIQVKNPLDVARTDALLRLDTDKLTAAFPDIDWKVVKFTTGETPVPFQANDLDTDGTIDEVVLLLDMQPEEEKNILIEPLAEGEAMPDFEKRTQAELAHKVNGKWEDREYAGGEFKNVNYLRVPPEHTDHSWFIRYEGPGWESDRVGYRFYLDWRNATDIFGKRTPEMVLQQVGLDGFDSYHEPADWGMDVLKVGESLGIGALGTWQDGRALRVETTDSIDCRIVLDGDLESLVRTRYYGWEAGDIITDVTSEISIHAGSRLSRHDVMLSRPLPNLCTGIVKHEDGRLFSAENGEWAYIATWGVQSLAEDQLGMAIVYQKDDLIEITEDDHSHVIVLRAGEPLSYYFLAAWEQEPGGIKTEESFREYLDGLVIELGAPLSVIWPQETVVGQ